MTEQTRRMVREWVERDGGNTERTARWMRDSLRIGGIRVCREMIAEALAAIECVSGAGAGAQCEETAEALLDDWALCEGHMASQRPLREALGHGVVEALS